jgi:hypothetical protein
MRIFMTMLAAGVLASGAQAQDAAPAEPANVPNCDWQHRDGCRQTRAQERKAITAEQADARDARHNGEWSPNHQRRLRKPKD